jgi:hypothetical protein
MTSRHELITQVEALKAEVERHRKARHEIRDRNWQLEDQVDELRALIDRTKQIQGPGHEVLWECNDGRVMSKPAAKSREDWIRLFAASLAAQDDAVIDWCVATAFDLWMLLEARFEKERAEAAPEPEPEGD